MIDKQVNVSAYLSTMWLFLGGISTYIIWKYGNHKIFPWHSYPTIWLQYFCAIGIILLVPLDVSVTIIGRYRQNYYFSNINTIIDMYLSLYWPTLVLSNVILVFQELYNGSGYFTFKTKLKDLIMQTFYQIIFGIIFGSIFFGILVGKHVIPASMDAVLLTSVLITNTIGLTFLVFLLGYGLVVFPKIVWMRGNHQEHLKEIQRRACKEYEDMADAKLEISLCVADILKTKEEIKSREFDNELEYLELLCPSEFTSAKAGKVAIDPKTNTVTLASLSKLKNSLYWNKSKYTMAQQKVEELQQTAYFLEDIIASSNSDSKIIKWSTKPESSIIEYYWYVHMYPIIFRIFGFIFGVVSLLSYLGVLGSINGVPLNTSPYFVAIHDNKTTGSGIVIFVLLTLGYACYVTVWALFQIKISGVMELVSNHGTWPISMSFNARMVARLASPLAFFYLGWIHENQIIGGEFENSSSGESLYTAFSRFYKIQVVPIMGNSFNTFFPILMMCISFLTATNILNRIFVMMKCPGLQFGQTLISEEDLNEGKKKLADRKKQVIRQYERAEFREAITSSGTVTDIEANRKIGSIPYDKKLLRTMEDFSLDDIGFDDSDTKELNPNNSSKGVLKLKNPLKSILKLFTK